jgi:hypothetical protein
MVVVSAARWWTLDGDGDHMVNGGFMVTIDVRHNFSSPCSRYVPIFSRTLEKSTKREQNANMKPE